MADYTHILEVATRLIANYGRSVTFVKLSETPADSNKPWKGPSGAETTLVLNGVFVPPTSLKQFGLSGLGQGTELKDLVSFTDQILIVTPGENDIREFTSVIDDNERWGIVVVQVLKPGTTTLLAYVLVRR